MISQKTVNLYGWITLGILVILLVLVWTGHVGPEMRPTVLIIAGVLIISRVILRLFSVRSQAKKGGDAE